MTNKTITLACPFCGGEPKVTRTAGDERDGYALRISYVCKGCGCSRGAVGESGKGGYADNSAVDLRALAAWNTRAALAAPVPPAGGEVEVLAWLYKRHSPPFGKPTQHIAIDSENMTELREGLVGTGIPCDNHFDWRPLVDRAHVTRLQAEVEKWKRNAFEQKEQKNEALDMANERREQRDTLQSELTKARELLEYMLHEDDMPVLWFAQRIDAFLSNQSAPADKGQGEPVAWANWKVGTKSYVPFRTKEEASRSVERSEIAATQLGPYRVVRLYAEQPAPVAVVMPERMPVPVYQIAPLAAESAIGWNNCLKEVARLNPGRPEKSAPVQVLAEAREWLGDGKHADGLAREHWTPEYAALIDRIDATLSK